MLPASAAFVWQFARKCSPNLRKINPKVLPQEATAIATGLYRILKDRGPLTVSHTWNRAKEAGVNGLNRKTHMKIMFKWMRGRELLKLVCTWDLVRSSSIQFCRKNHQLPKEMQLKLLHTRIRKG